MTMYRVRQNDTGDEFELGVEDALRMLCEGTAALALEQKQAPLRLAEHLTLRAADIDRLGHRTDLPKRMQRINERLFVSGLRQNNAGFHPISWLEGSRDLRNAVETQLSTCSVERVNLFRQLESVYHHRISTKGELIGSRRELSDDEQRDHDLVPIPHQGVMLVGNDPEYIRISSDWRQVYDRLRTSQYKLRETIEVGLSEGRIICSQSKPHGDVYVPPPSVAPFKSHRKNHGFFYALACEIPSDWFEDNDSLPRRRREARAWINRAGSHFAKQGRRAQSDHLKSIASQRYDLSENAVDMIWRDCDFPNKGRKGSIPDRQKVSLSEIREVE